MIMEEKWVDIKGFEGLYQISNKGRLKHYTKRNGWNILTQTNKNGDYFSIILTGKDGYKKSTRIHRLVAQHFIPNPLNLPQVNHIDMNKQNNCVDNLEWCSAQHNTREAIKQKPQMILGMTNYNTKIRPKRIAQYTLDKKLIGVYINAQDAGRKTNVCSRNILQVARKEPFNKFGKTRKQAGGFIWKFTKKGVSL